VFCIDDDYQKLRTCYILLWLQEQWHSLMRSLVRELDPSSWKTYSAVALNLVLWIVHTMELAIITVAIVKMLVSDV